MRSPVSRFLYRPFPCPCEVPAVIYSTHLPLVSFSIQFNVKSTFSICFLSLCIAIPLFTSWLGYPRCALNILYILSPLFPSSRQFLFSLSPVLILCLGTFYFICYPLSRLWPIGNCCARLRTTLRMSPTPFKLYIQRNFPPFVFFLITSIARPFKIRF